MVFGAQKYFSADTDRINRKRTIDMPDKDQQEVCSRYGTFGMQKLSYEAPVFTGSDFGFLCPYPDFFVTCDDVTLVVGTLDQIVALSRIAFDGLFPDGSETTVGEWYRADNPQRNARSVVEHLFNAWKDLDCSKVSMPFIVLYQGRVVGTQGLSGKGVPYATSRELGTGSWLDPRYRGQGIGKKARHAILHTAFEGFHAETVISSALTTNLASQRVSLACGYHSDGMEVQIVHGKRVELTRYRVNRKQWKALDKPLITMCGYEQMTKDLGVVLE